MKNPAKKLDKVLLFSRNQVFCLKTWKIWRAPTTLEFNVFYWNFVHVFYLPMSTKGCSGFFWFCLDLELYLQKLKRPGLYTFVFQIFINNSKSKQNKKNPEHPFVDIIK